MEPDYLADLEILMNEDEALVKPLVALLFKVAQTRVKKNQDYNSNVALAEYFPDGVTSILCFMNTKMLRLRSLLTPSAKDANFEGVYDSIEDLVNYTLFLNEFLKFQLPGQIPGRDMFNKPWPAPAPKTLVEHIDAAARKAKKQVALASPTHTGKA